MKKLGIIRKHLRKLRRRPNKNLLTGIDSHKWESKIEIYRSFRRY